MFPSRFPRTDIPSGILRLFITLALLVLFGCGGGSGGGGDTGDDADDTPRDSAWQRSSIAQIGGGGLLIPNVKAVPDGNGRVHVAYFTDSVVSDGDYTVNHVLWDIPTGSEVSRDSIVDIDNCRTLALSLGPDGSPVAAYQGGTIRAGGSEQQSDVMVSIFRNDAWTEYTGGIGFVERNPVFEDGLAGKHVAAAVDGLGDIHLCYQFFYEGIDAMNFNYPDLFYVRKDGTLPDTEGTEETVEGNVYNDNGTASEQNRVGERIAMVLDAAGSPVVFYAADLAPTSSDPDTKGLRVAFRDNGTWVSEWVDTGFDVGDISCTLDGHGSPCVAYYVDGEYTDSYGVTHGQCLKYASRTASTWAAGLVDETSLCGTYCSLAFDPSGNPAIAYYAMENHSGSLTLNDLRMARLSGSVWDKEAVATAGDIGMYNSLWFDEDGTAYICTFSDTDQTIYLYYR